MTKQERCGLDNCRKAGDPVISRRRVVASLSLGLVGVLSGVALGQEKKETDRKETNAGPSKSGQERMEQFKAYAERMRNASPEERMKIMEERRVQDRQRAIEDLRDQLEVSDKEWAVIKPRVEKVYNLTHPLPQVRGGTQQPRTDVEQRSTELRELLRDKGVAPDQIKAKLAALRAAKEKAAQELARAKQDLRQLLTLRQEATLVLNGLLD
jgi:DNA repair exonuclease SbcCD ATPase subunit